MRREYKISFALKEDAEKIIFTLQDCRYILTFHAEKKSGIKSKLPNKN